jgi:hypothetical protein
MKELRKGDLELLTQLLSLQPGAAADEAWLRDQAQLIASFPPSLRRPEPLLPRLALALPFTSDKAHLCKTHKLLNPQLIRRIFLQVSAECTTRVARISQHPKLPENVSQFLKRIQSVNSLWMSPELYRQAFKVKPYEARFEPIPGGCEACILAAVGGNRQTISDFRTSMIGRKKKRGSTPRLLPLVESWIEWTGRGSEICEETDVLACEVRGIRRQLQHARRQLRRNNVEGTADHNPEPRQDHSQPPESFDFGPDDDDKEHTNEHDFEGSVIDYYANIMSTTNLLEHSQKAEGIHPAIRHSIAFDPVTGTFHRAGAEPQRQRPRTTYSESVYSNSARTGPSRQHARQADLRGYSDDHARAYETLTGYSDMSGSSRQPEADRGTRRQNGGAHPRQMGIHRDEGFESRTTRSASRHGDRVTRMSDFF